MRSSLHEEAVQLTLCMYMWARKDTYSILVVKLIIVQKGSWTDVYNKL
jgi:hypothetical protein